MIKPNIVDTNLKFYDHIKPKNPTSTYTVLATVNDSRTGALLALANGTQACLKTYPLDIEDCHAESLVKRAYKRHLIHRLHEVCNKATTSRDCIARDLSNNVTLFVSQFPCGLIRRYDGDKGEIGVPMKRKPGRGTVKDGKTVYVDKNPCLIKLKKWVQHGLQGSSIRSKFNIESKIDKIIIGTNEFDEHVDYNSYLDVLRRELSCQDEVIVELSDTAHREEFVFGTSKQPKPITLAWWSTTSTTDEMAIKNGDFDLIVDGRKRGLTKKQCSSDKTMYKLKIATESLREDLRYIQER